MTKRAIATVLIAAVTLAVDVSPAEAQTAGMLSFQGLIKDGAGNPIDGPVALEFRLFDVQSDGAQVGETWTVSATADRGVVATNFGPVAPEVLDGFPLWLEVNANGSTLPRIELNTWPGAMVPGGGSSAIAVSPSGDVGIGISSPNARLEVQGYKSYLTNYPIAASTGAFGDPSDFYILLHRAYDGGCSQPHDPGCLSDHYVFGTITARRGDVGAWNRKAVININSASAYQTNRIQLTNVFEDWQPVTVRHHGQLYLALRPPVGSTLSHLEFTGWADVPEGEILLAIVYKQEVSDARNIGGDYTAIHGPTTIHGGLDVKGFTLALHGPDFVMAYPPRGNGGRALVHGGSGSGADDQLIINFGGDFEAGTRVMGSRFQVDGEFHAGGVGSVRTLQIRGGADLAEPFEVNGSAIACDAIAPGMVVTIDSDQPGYLRLANEAYDKRVAGVISGANGLSPGMVMRAEGTPHADGQYPVALTGRVYVWADASYGSIESGDLLTTSSTPGHAMQAADPARSFGAVIGKAMQPLTEGRQMILVLVNLQ